jgi:hypothetical protein|tara:strand:+ start:155 stop:655 length:501 start_codon:yes stop_codon:yes gene_type:complete
MRKKSQELLDNLNKITENPKSRFEQENFESYTNRHYPSTMHKLPTSYDKAKRYKDEYDEEYIKIDRVYGGVYEHQLRQKDNTIYKGKLYNKRRLIKNETDDKNFYSKCTVTADGRWFDNCGFPIEPPKEVEVEKKEKEEEHTSEMWSSEPKEKKEKIELSMLKKLK